MYNKTYNINMTYITKISTFATFEQPYWTSASVVSLSPIFCDTVTKVQIYAFSKEK